jgi:hypothetical protein
MLGCRPQRLGGATSQGTDFDTAGRHPRGAKTFEARPSMLNIDPDPMQKQPSRLRVPINQCPQIKLETHQLTEERDHEDQRETLFGVFSRSSG